jgi:hypothetical protein
VLEKTRARFGVLSPILPPRVEKREKTAAFLDLCREI